MTDFVRTMRDWRRMCEKYTTNDDDCCVGCPVVDYHEHGCGAIFEMDDIDWARYEQAIDKWAEENPEPTYPTWEEYFISKGFLIPFWDERGTPLQQICIYAKWALEKPIPADIAQKLGVKPKEGI